MGRVVCRMFSTKRLAPARNVWVRPDIVHRALHSHASAFTHASSCSRDGRSGADGRASAPTSSVTAAGTVRWRRRNP